MIKLNSGAQDLWLPLMIWRSKLKSLLLRVDARNRTLTKVRYMASDLYVNIDVMNGLCWLIASARRC